MSWNLHPINYDSIVEMWKTWSHLSIHGWVWALTFLIAYLLVTWLLVTGRSNISRPGWKIMPNCSGDLLACAFHALELVIFNALFFGSLMAIRSLTEWLWMSGCAASILLIILSGVLWKHDTTLTKTGMLWGIAGALIFITVIGLNPLSRYGFIAHLLRDGIVMIPIIAILYWIYRNVNDAIVKRYLCLSALTVIMLLLLAWTFFL